MKVYLVESDADYFGASCREAHQMRAILDADWENKPLTGHSEIIGWYYPDDGKQEPVLTDFGHLGFGTALILHRPRTDVLRPMLLDVGTILPMTPWMGHTFEAFICDAQLDAIDPGRMVYHPEGEEFLGTEIMRYAFKPDVVADATLFRAKGLRGRMFATDRFLDVVKANGLLGLQVLPLWCSETGPIATLVDPTDEFQRHPPAPGKSGREKRAAMQAILARRG